MIKKAWYCPVCKRFDLVDVKEQLAKPEHVSHRGVDIGDCKGIMIPLYELSGEELKLLEGDYLDAFVQL